MPSSNVLLVAALYNAALLQASSAVPPTGLSTGGSLVLTSGTVASASFGLPRGHSSSTYNSSIQLSTRLPSQLQSGSRTQINTSPFSTVPSSSRSAPASANSQSSSPADSASSTGPSSAGSSVSVGPSSPSGSRSSQTPSSVSGQTDVVATVNGTAVTETFIPTTYSGYSSLTAPLSTFTTDAQSSTIPLIIGPGGVGWQIPSEPPSAPELPPPTSLPTSSTAPSATPSNSITSAPSSTHTLSGTEITSTSIASVTKNTVTTTSENGHQTVLPIVFCPGCGGGGGGHGLSWIIHPPSINPPGGIEFNIPGVKWPFTVDPSGNPKPVDPSEPEPKPDDQNNSSKSKESSSQSSTSEVTSSGSSSASSSGSSSASSSESSSSSASRTGSATIAIDADVDPYFTDPPQDTIADVQAYLSSMFATEFDQVGTTLESMTSSPTGSSSSPSSSHSSITNAPSRTTSTSANPVTCLNNPVVQDPPGCIQPSSSSSPFSCSAGSNVGLATYDPATWCGCNSGTDIYPTMTTGTGNAACAYTKPPSTTVKPTHVTSTTSPSSTASTSAGPVTCLNNPVVQDPPGCIQPSSSSAPFSCSAGSNIGLATYDPATWCGCNSGTDIYPTMTTGTGNAACAYSKPPGTTVKPTQVTPTSAH